MEEYRFEHKEPLTQRVVLALRVNTKQLKEQLWLGTEYEVEAALRGLDKPLYLSQTRPLGAFWCEFGKTSADGWTEAVWALLGTLSARKAAERIAGERNAAELLSQLVMGNSAALYATIQIWEMYLRCCRGRDKYKAETADPALWGILAGDGKLETGKAGCSRMESSGRRQAGNLVSLWRSPL